MQKTNVYENYYLWSKKKPIGFFIRNRLERAMIFIFSGPSGIFIFLLWALLWIILSKCPQFHFPGTWRSWYNPFREKDFIEKLFPGAVISVCSILFAIFQYVKREYENYSLLANYNQNIIPPTLLKDFFLPNFIKLCSNYCLLFSLIVQGIAVPQKLYLWFYSMLLYQLGSILCSLYALNQMISVKIIEMRIHKGFKAIIWDHYKGCKPKKDLSPTSGNALKPESNIAIALKCFVDTFCRIRTDANGLSTQFDALSDLCLDILYEIYNKANWDSTENIFHQSFRRSYDYMDQLLDQLPLKEDQKTNLLLSLLDKVFDPLFLEQKDYLKKGIMPPKPHEKYFKNPPVIHKLAWTLWHEEEALKENTNLQKVCFRDYYDGFIFAVLTVSFDMGKNRFQREANVFLHYQKKLELYSKLFISEPCQHILSCQHILLGHTLLKMYRSMIRFLPQYADCMKGMTLLLECLFKFESDKKNENALSDETLSKLFFIWHKWCDNWHKNYGNDASIEKSLTYLSTKVLIKISNNIREAI